jgi:two-component system OmpR family response regulator
VPVKSPSSPQALIIDDETDICYLLGNILRQKNMTTVFAGTLAEAQRIIQTSSGFLVIFLDNHLPDGLGMNMINVLKKTYPQTRLIMISAHDTTADRNKATSDGVDYFIGKPFSKESILKTIESIVV